ncbi:phospholipid scramblase 1 [Copidosoma floridanum]|uniref:phospholipid scramblase 1 n=1 Tax=Copidosoma floridanum TaxID=29053 RepID=UPI0006C97E20|nr:phospholipid scramblase 1 [Copidosoma floridanum]
MFQENFHRQPQRRSPTPLDDGLFLPPIYTGPSTITSQPVSNRQNQRSEMSPDSLDWVSTFHSSHMSAFSGTYFLSSVEQLEIQQIVDLNFLLGRTENQSQYRVKVPRAETIFLAVERSGKYQRRFLRSSRQLELNIMDPSGETAFIVRKPLSWGCVPTFLHKITVETSDLIGSVEQNFTLISTSLTVYDENRQALCYIEGPPVCSCCMSRETQFQILSTDRSRQIASLIRHWDSALVDYSTLLTFPLNTAVKLKSLLLGAAFLLEFLYFANQRSSSLASRMLQ